LLARLDDELAAPLADLATDVQRFLADRQLTVPAPLATADLVHEQELQQAVAAIPGAGNALARVLERLTAGGEAGLVSRELAPLITDAIDRRAEDAAARCAGFFVRLLNLLPLATLAHITYEIANTWVQHEWLPGTFYLHAAAIFLLTLLPGYLLICVNVGRQLRRTETLAGILSAADRLPATGPALALATVRADLAAILTGLRALRSRASSVRGAIDTEFGVSALGSRPQVPGESAVS
jgi:hypothetical protein